MKNFQFAAFSIATLVLAGCREIPNDIIEMTSGPQSGLVWIAKGETFELESEKTNLTFTSGDKVVLRYDSGKRILWDVRPNVTISRGNEKAIVELPKSLDNYAQSWLNAYETNQHYSISLFRKNEKTRAWSKPHNETKDNLGLDNQVTMRRTGSYIDHYFDGIIEYQIGFYNSEKKPIAVFYIKKAVKDFVEKTEEL